jgi:hypothetical protein
MATGRLGSVAVAIAVVLATQSLLACGSSTVSSVGTSSSAAAGTSTATATSADFSMKTAVRCDANHNQEVTWTLLNTGAQLEVISAKVDGAAQAEPVFSPSPVPTGGSTTAMLTVPGSVQGDLDLHLIVSFGSPVTTGGTTQLKGNC